MSEKNDLPVAPSHEISLWGVRKIVDAALRKYTALHIAGLEQIRDNGGDQGGANRGAPQFKLTLAGSATGQMLKDLGADLEKGIAKAGPPKWARWADVTIGGSVGSGEDATYEFILHMPPGVYVKQFWKEDAAMGSMQEILERVAGETIGEAVGANLVTRMAEAMLSAPKLAVLMTRAFDDESQEGLFAGMIQGPLEALIAKALDAAGATVSGGVLSKSNREMRGAARGPLETE